jgi:hypothetical protein
MLFLTEHIPFENRNFLILQSILISFASFLLLKTFWHNFSINEFLNNLTYLDYSYTEYDYFIQPTCINTHLFLGIY